MKNYEDLHGRLGTVTDTGFEIQLGKGNKTHSRTLLFQEVQTVRAQEHGISKSTKCILIGIGAVVGIVLAIAAAQGAFGES